MKRILVPIDSSDVTPRVIGVAQQLATALNVDLIVMGTHGHSAMYNLLVGGVTNAYSNAVHVRCYLCQALDVSFAAARLFEELALSLRNERKPGR